MKDIIIIGSGPAALTAAVYLARAEMDILVIGGKRPGGQLMSTAEVENFPGFPEGIQGPELVMNMEKQAKRFGAKIINDNATAVAKGKKGFSVKFGGKKEEALSIIIATGSNYRKLGIPGEKEYSAKGVSYCAVCDAAFFKGKNVIVAGGGDSAMEEALAAAKYASKVFIVHRRDCLRASKIMQERVLSNKKIEVLWNSEVKEILGDGKKVTGVKILNNKDGSERTVECEGIFPAIGSAPNSEIFKGIVDIDEKGYIKTDKRQRTNTEGIFAAGDVQDYLYRQAITSAGAGCAAALEAERYVEEIKHKGEGNKAAKC